MSGGTALLTGTFIAGASYLWTPPAGVSLPVLNTRVLQIPNATTAQAGDYQLKINSGGCEVALSARLDVDLCDNLYIKAFDPTNGEEKTRLNRKPGQLNLYDDLVLQVETFEGEVLKGVEYTWTLPQGVTVGQDPADKSKITINKIGNYKVNVTSTGGVSCPLEVDISALACATPAEFLACGSTSTVTSTGTEKLKNLAVGDVFSTYDYVVSVTEVSGSEATGWTGRGFIEMSFLKLGPAALKVPLGVRSDNIHLNQCYQLLPGSKVITEFDPTWSNMADLDILADRVSILYAEIRDILATKPDNKEELQAKLDELQTLKDDLSTSGLQANYIDEQTSALTSVIETGTCYVGSPGSRTTSSCSAPDFVAAVGGAEQVLAKIVPSVYLSKINLSLNSSFAHGLADGIIDASPVGVFKFAFEVITDEEVRNTLIEGVQALADEPVEVVKAIATDKYDSWKSVLHGNGTEQQKYNVGADLGSLIGSFITGAGIKKVVNEIRGETNVENLAKAVGVNVGKRFFKVDNALKAADEAAGILINGSYLKNPTAKNVIELIKTPSGVLKLGNSSSSILNGQYMYVIDKSNNIIIGTRAAGIPPFNGKAPHPTLIGGADPQVRTAGIIEFRAGKIYKIDNVSGHYKPTAQSFRDAQPLFEQKFSLDSFANNFQGFVPFSN